MTQLIDKSTLLKEFTDTRTQINFELPVKEILGEDVDMEDFTMLMQEGIQVYKNMVLNTIQKQPTITKTEIREKIVNIFLEEATKWNKNSTKKVPLVFINYIVEQLRNGD